MPESFGGNDFVGNSHALTFPSGSGQMIKSVNFFVRNDNIPETNETFTVSLLISNQPNVAKLGEPDTARITILANDDAFGIFSFETVSNSNTVKIAILANGDAFGILSFQTVSNNSNSQNCYISK